jgi:hypothetical protein
MPREVSPAPIGTLCKVRLQPRIDCHPPLPAFAGSISWISQIGRDISLKFVSLMRVKTLHCVPFSSYSEHANEDN